MFEGTFAKYQPKMNLAPIKEVLGEDIPDITPTPLGRYRLVQSLKAKFGENYRNIPSARKVMDHFDSEHDYFSKLRKIQGGS
jgi:hypothetical protein